jgi:predicted DNA-binding ribbon-helix-helix protein
MKSAIRKRSIVVCGHKTSVSLEDPFWNCLKDIAKDHKITLSDVVADIESRRQYGNLSSAIRLFVLQRSRSQAPSANQVANDISVLRATPESRQPH